jgi:aminoglycoside phosphotransferase (APT) family kinase protein
MKAASVLSIKEQLRELWRAAGGTHDILDVDMIQGERFRSVYRLHFRRGHPPVIAKYCPTKDAHAEHRVYLEILPAWGIDGPAAYGLVATDDPGRSCFFMGDVGGRLYDPSRKPDRELAAEWLATLHILADQHEVPASLKDRSFEYYGPSLKKCTELLSKHSNNPILSKDEQQLLQCLHDFSTTLERHWQDIATFCRSMPQALIHGDFKEDNMRVIDDPDGPRIITFDWANVGWAAPCLDLAKFTGYSVDPDLEIYLQRLQRHWPDIDKADIVRLAYIGEIFRWVETVRWHVEEIEYGKQEAAMCRMAVYETWMNDIRRMEPWKESDLVSSGRWKINLKHWH